mmetsp:Transcript_7998/g.49409  ORF Transcript_7998/g.49409 Transcript_7998/m.49409 type:complete len:210 (+) Transcript_7998:1466-2095(+)
MIVLGHLLRILADHIRMCFRIPRTSNTKDISAFVANELDQIQRTGEPSLRSDECLLTFRRIPSQCQDVLHAALLQSLQCMFQLFLGHIGAREVHHRFDTDHVLHLLGDVQREIRGRTSGSPGDIAKERSCSHHLVHPHEQVFNSLNSHTLGSSTIACLADIGRLGSLASRERPSGRVLFDSSLPLLSWAGKIRRRRTSCPPPWPGGSFR